MKNFSKMMIAALAISIASAGFVGCKKGDEDPGISMKSRKGRVAGEWTLKEQTMTYEWTMASSDDISISNEVTSQNGKSSMTYDGSLVSETSEGRTTYDDGNYTTYDEKSSGTSISRTETAYAVGFGTVSSTSSGTYSHTYDLAVTIETDGTYELTSTRVRKTVYSTVDSDKTRTETETSTETVTNSGTWSFIGKDKTNEFKNKERVGLWNSSTNTTTVTDSKVEYVDHNASDFTVWSDYNTTDKTTVTDDDAAVNETPDEVWEIVMLKSKEMKVIGTGTSTGSNKSTNAHTELVLGVSTTTNSSDTYSNTASWTTESTFEIK